MKPRPKTTQVAPEIQEYMAAELAWLISISV
jgi:hypothetical protein